MLPLPQIPVKRPILSPRWKGTQATLPHIVDGGSFALDFFGPGLKLAKHAAGGLEPPSAASTSFRAPARVRRRKTFDKKRSIVFPSFRVAFGQRT